MEFESLIIGFLLGLIFVFIGLPKLREWFEGRKEDEI